MLNIVKITDYMSEDLICLDLTARTKDEVLRELSTLMGKAPHIGTNSEVIYKALLEREKLGSTGIGKGVAIPHAKTDAVEDRKSTRLNSSHANISYAVFCLKKKKDHPQPTR